MNYQIIHEIFRGVESLSYTLLLIIKEKLQRLVVLRNKSVDEYTVKDDIVLNICWGSIVIALKQILNDFMTPSHFCSVSLKKSFFIYSNFKKWLEKYKNLHISDMWYQQCFIWMWRRHNIYIFHAYIFLKYWDVRTLHAVMYVHVLHITSILSYT